VTRKTAGAWRRQIPEFAGGTAASTGCGGIFVAALAKK